MFGGGEMAAAARLAKPTPAPNSRTVLPDRSSQPKEDDTRDAKTTALIQGDPPVDALCGQGRKCGDRRNLCRAAQGGAAPRPRGEKIDDHDGLNTVDMARETRYKQCLLIAQRLGHASAISGTTTCRHFVPHLRTLAHCDHGVLGDELLLHRGRA